MKDTAEGRAVKIAAKIMQAAGLCRYDDVIKCHRLYTDETACDECIRRWLLTKARKGLKEENKGGGNVSKRVTRAQLRGQPLDPLCKKAQTTTGEYGPDDKRVFCYGWVYATTGEPEDLCAVCGAYVRNKTPSESRREAHDRQSKNGGQLAPGTV